MFGSMKTLNKTKNYKNAVNKNVTYMKTIIIF